VGAAVTWLLEEDTLLKDKVSGMTVSDQREDPRPVPVWYRFPEQELRDVTYPFVTIDLIGISEALDRAHRGGRMRPDEQQFLPAGELPAPEAGRVPVTEWPIAMDLSYQVTTWTRNVHHDRDLTRQMWVRFPGRYGSIGGSVSPYVRARSCQLMGYMPGDRIDDFGKRLFRKMYTIKVFSELWASQIRNITLVTTITIDVPSLFGNEAGWLNVIGCNE
jgi:hypothetical protein